jgi:hypothetical protein
MSGDSRKALVYARTFASHGLRSSANPTSSSIDWCGCSCEKSGARPSAVSAFTSLLERILISASAALRYCASVSSQMARRTICSSLSTGTAVPGPPLGIRCSPTLCVLSSLYSPVRTETCSQRLRFSALESSAPFEPETSALCVSLMV